MRMVRARLAVCALVFLLWQGLGLAGLSAACCRPTESRVTDAHACCSGMAPGAFCPMHARTPRPEKASCRLTASCLEPEPGIVMAWQAPLPAGPVVDLPREVRVASTASVVSPLARPEPPPDRPPRA